MKFFHQVAFASLLLFSACQSKSSEIDYTDWSNYGGASDGSRYSSLSQITRENVSQLEVAWTYNTGYATEKSQIQCQPIVANGLLYAATPAMNIFALDPATGKELWRFDPFQVLGGDNSWAGMSRGVTYWEEGDDRRILFGAGSWLISVNADTGEPTMDFGNQGKVDLQKDLDTERQDFLITANAPGVIYGDLIIIGMRLSEGLDAAPGHIRAYNVRTGKREWIFHTIPHKGEFGYSTWDSTSVSQIGGANNWAGMTVDQERGIVFVPTGSATYDFWGGYRKGDNLFSNSLLALNAKTGERIWHFQAIHHDVWDRDFPANPNLIRIKKDGKWIDAVAQISKQGMTYVFDRETGEPVWPIVETPVTQTEMPGEFTSPTQPIPSLPEPFMNMVFEEKDILNLKPEWEKDIRDQLENSVYGDMWAPPHPEKTLVHFPGMDGGAEWGGASFDPTTQTMYINANQVPWLISMTPNTSTEVSGRSVYANYCGNCHGLERKGNAPAIPSLLQVKERYSYDSLVSLLQKGRGAMPSFAHISDENITLLMGFLLDKAPEERSTHEMKGAESQLNPHYYMDGYKMLLTKEGLYGSNPPWGLLTAIDMNTGKKEMAGDFG